MRTSTLFLLLFFFLPSLVFSLLSYSTIHSNNSQVFSMYAHIVFDFYLHKTNLISRSYRIVSISSSSINIQRFHRLSFYPSFYMHLCLWNDIDYTLFSTHIRTLNLHVEDVILTLKIVNQSDVWMNSVDFATRQNKDCSSCLIGLFFFFFFLLSTCIIEIVHKPHPHPHADSIDFSSIHDICIPYSFSFHFICYSVSCSNEIDQSKHLVFFFLLVLKQTKSINSYANIRRTSSTYALRWLAFDVKELFRLSRVRTCKDTRFSSFIWTYHPQCMNELEYNLWY